LPCGHWMHLSCVQQHFKPECPVCRKPLDIVVTGIPPDPNIPFQIEEPENEETQVIEHALIARHFVMMNVPSTVMGDVVEHFDETEEDNEIYVDEDEEEEDDDRKCSWRRKGYLYREEDSDYDEENPRGDDWTYDSY